jgi:hypothetical protein
MINHLWRKGIVLAYVFMSIFGAMNISTTAHKTVITDDVATKSLFGLQSVILVSWDGNDTQEPLEPLGVPAIITLNVSYYIVGGLFRQIIFSYFSLTKPYITVSLEVEDIPNYCNASLKSTSLQFPITDTGSTQHTVLTIRVDETAPAFEPFTLKIHASVDDTMGPFGILPLIQGSETTPLFVFIADYLPMLQVSVEDPYIKTKPGTTVVDPITVKNLGNGDTIVIADIVECPKDWIAIITGDIYLEVNDSKPMNLTIITPKNFYGFETIVLMFTPCYYTDFNNRGEPHYVSIGVEVKP